MADLAKQNQMLKDYVVALEGENKSRNLEKDTLLRQIQMLDEDNNYLRAQLANLNKNPTASNPNQVEELHRVKRQFQQNMNHMRHQLQILVQQRNALDSENSRLKKDIEELNQRIKNVQSASSSSNNSVNNELVNLKVQNQQLKKKISQLQKIQRQISQFQKQNKQLRQTVTHLQQREQTQSRDSRQNQQKIALQKSRQAEKIKQMVRKQMMAQKQLEISQMKNNFNHLISKRDEIIRELQKNLNEMQIKIYDNNQNQSQSAELRQLKIIKAELQNKLVLFERDKNGLDNKIKELKSQLSHKDVMLNQRKFQSSELQQMKNEMNKKQQQIIRSGSVIQALKQNSSMLQQKIHQLQTHIQFMKQQQNDRNINTDQFKRQQISKIEKKYQKQLKMLKQQLLNHEKNFPMLINEQKKYSEQKDRQNQQLKRILAELSENNKNLLEKMKYIQQKEEQAQERQPLQTQNRAELDNMILNANLSNQVDLRKIVEELRDQLKEVKTDFKRMQFQNRKMQSMISSKANDTSNIRQSNYNNYQNQIPINYPFANQSVGGHLHLRQKQRKVVSNVNMDEMTPSQSYKSINVQQPQMVPVPDPPIKYSKLREAVGHDKSKGSAREKQVNSKSMQQDKWKMLQRRINQLRQQNQQLKHSLYS